MLDLPRVFQRDDWSCGQTAARVVFQHFGLRGRAWFAGMAAAAYADAAAWRKRAEEYRGRAGFEGHQSDALLTWASWMDAVADGLAADACRFTGWSGQSWQRPRRIVADEFRTWGR